MGNALPVITNRGPRERHRLTAFRPLSTPFSPDPRVGRSAPSLADWTVATAAGRARPVRRPPRRPDR